jgi:hypothetical protein
MSEEKKPFTVTDRRHFTPEGGSREEEDAAREATSPAGDPPPEAQSKGVEAEAGEGRAGARGAFPADFAGLVLSLGAQASLLLGIGLAGVEGAPAPDFEGARSLISLLEVLKEKTDGRRTPEEERILDGILYELRMAYVAGTRAGGA